MVNLFSALLQAARGYDLDDAFSYDTNKVVKIRDRKLGFLYYTFWLGIFVYIILALFYSQNFVKIESPVGSVAIWTEERPEFDAVDTNEAYCQNSSYNYVYQPNCWSASDVPCEKKPMRYMFRHATSTEKSLVTVEFNSSTQGNGFCTDHFRFIPGAEHLDLVIEHSLVSKQAAIKKKNVECKLVDGEGNTVRTIPQGSSIRVSVTEALALAGMSLDGKQVIGSINDDDTEAFVRLTGAIILVELTYRNYDEPFVISGEEIACQASFTASPGQWGIIDQVETEDGFLTRMGLQFKFLTVGEIGRFSFVALMTTLVSAAVLFKTASTIVDFVALSILKRRYLYRTAKYEWTGDYHDSRGKDLFDIVAEDHIPVTRRDLRAVMHNLIAKLRAEKVKGGKIRLAKFESTFAEEKLLPTRRGWCGDCRCRRPPLDDSIKRSKSVSRPKVDLIEWEQLVQGNGTEQWGLYDYRQRSLCQRTLHVFQEGLGFDVESERYRENGPNNSARAPAVSMRSATIHVGSHMGEDADDNNNESPVDDSVSTPVSRVDQDNTPGLQAEEKKDDTTSAGQL